MEIVRMCYSLLDPVEAAHGETQVENNQGESEP